MSVDKERIALFHEICANGKLDLISRMLKETPALINAKDKLGWAAIHVTLYNQQYEAAKLLLQHPDVAVFILNNDLATPFHFAVKTQEEKPPSALYSVLELLLEKGASINSQQKSGYTALHEVCQKGNHKIARWLLDHKINLELKSKYVSHCQVTFRVSNTDLVSS